MKLNKKLSPIFTEEGFTILELLVVLIIIGVLVAFIVSTYAGIRQKERNTLRQNNITLLQGKLELYHAEFFNYPTFNELNNPDWRAVNLKNFDNNILRDPSNTNTLLSPKPVAKSYAYIVTGSDGSACDNLAKKCTEYTITATLEGNATFTKSSLN